MLNSIPNPTPAPVTQYSFPDSVKQQSTVGSSSSSREPIQNSIRGSIWIDGDKRFEGERILVAERSRSRSFELRNQRFRAQTCRFGDNVPTNELFFDGRRLPLQLATADDSDAVSQMTSILTEIHCKFPGVTSILSLPNGIMEKSKKRDRRNTSGLSGSISSFGTISLSSSFLSNDGLCDGVIEEPCVLKIVDFNSCF
ncbi:hypothetical protein NE237_016565 [Protea cynaroides]|uniref:Uncharacterized protein n=1 Tax=Protea cynaroides TaxID=273540 RepID=A0A9Q0HDR1_9MAGN|nr:hypothetical protein NE237_016565 [Protea cynaroides]